MSAKSRPAVYREPSPPPDRPFHDALLGFGIQFLSYFNITLNLRGVAHEQYLWIMLTDALQVCISYTIIKHVAGAKGRWTLIGMSIGGALAGVAGTWVTRSWG